MLEFCYLPISGGHFICQIAILTMLLEAKYTTKKKNFDSYFTASGGNIACLICTLFDIDKFSIIRILNRFNSKLFLKNNNIFNLSFLLDSSLYDKGKGFENLVLDLFEKEKILDSPEIWILTYNTILDTGSLNCTKTKELSLFKNINKKDIIDYGCYDINYLKGNIELISKTCKASASIPGITKSVEINEIPYIDGGISNATSGSFFSNIYDTLDNKDNIYHYIYIYPCKLNDIVHRQKFINKKSDAYWFNNIFNAVNNFSCSSIINDRHFMFENWLRLTNNKKQNLKNKVIDNITLINLIDIINKYHEHSYFMTFSCDSNPVDISNFTNEDIKKCFDLSYNSIKIELFY